MKTAITGLLGIAVGAFLVFLSFSRSSEAPPPTIATGRFQHISTDKIPADERTGILFGTSDRVIDTATGQIYQRGWTLSATTQGVKEVVTFLLVDPVGMSTNAEHKVQAVVTH